MAPDGAAEGVELVDRTAGLFPESARKRERPVASACEGVLPSQTIRHLIDEKRIQASEPVADSQIQPASLDLRLGTRAYRLRASFLPGKAKVESKLADLSMAKIDLSSANVLEKDCVYLVKLAEELWLPDYIEAKANPKSTTGRLDVFTRLITDYGAEFERVPNGYSGPLYAEIMPRTFSVIVHPGLSLSQIRFIRGQADLLDPQTRTLDRKEQLVYLDRTDPKKAKVRGGLELSVNLQGERAADVIAYKGRKNAPIVDMRRIDHYEPEEFWEAIAERPDNRLILDPGAFYILVSRERVRVPPDHAAEMVPFDPSVGEFRIHYAGFFDPGFGYGGDGSIPGTRAVLEVRAHEAPFVIEHGQVVGRLVYSRMLETPDKVYGQAIGSSYQRQELALSKQFRRAAGGAS